MDWCGSERIPRAEEADMNIKCSSAQFSGPAVSGGLIPRLFFELDCLALSESSMQLRTLLPEMRIAVMSQQSQDCKRDLYGYFSVKDGLLVDDEFAGTE